MAYGDLPLDAPLKDQGEGGTFSWKGKSYKLDIADDFPEFTAKQDSAARKKGFMDARDMYIYQKYGLKSDYAALNK